MAAEAAGGASRAAGGSMLLSGGDGDLHIDDGDMQDGSAVLDSAVPSQAQQLPTSDTSLPAAIRDSEIASGQGKEQPSTTAREESGPDNINDVTALPPSTGSPATSNTHLPKHDSLSSFTTAPDRNSIVSVGANAAASTSKRDTLGSMGMARIAEESPSPSGATPAPSTPSTGPRDAAANTTAASDAATGSALLNEDNRTSSILPSNPPQSTLTSQPSSSSLTPSSRNIAAGEESTASRSQETSVNDTTATRSNSSNTPTASTSTPSLQPATSSSPSSASQSSLSSSQRRSSGPRAAAHSTLAAGGPIQAGDGLEGNSTRSVLASSQNIQQLHSNAATLASPSPAASTSASSSTPRPTMPGHAGNLDTGSNEREQPTPTNEVFKVPTSVTSPASTPSLPGAYPQSSSSPNLQRNPSHQQLETLNTGSQQGDLHPRAPTRYSHAGFSTTHPPVTASSHHAAAMQVQRSSAPILAPSLPPNAYAYASGSHQQQQQQQFSPDLSFVSPPINMLGDAGFGSSSPYPPLGAQQQQRYSLPAQASSTIPTFSQPFPLHSSAAMAQTASLRPQPTMNYNTPGQSKHLPEMHPSALEARPSISAPFPPSSSPPRNPKGPNNATIATPAALQQRERPDTSRPLGQEICLECLMRDRDMADVEVTGPGVWSRNSDIDFEEALRAEEVAIAHSYQGHSNSNGMNGNYAGSSIEDHADLERRSHLVHNNNNQNGNGNGSTDENYQNLPPQVQNGRYQLARDGGQIRSPSRESSGSDAGSRGYRRQAPAPRRRLGIHDPLTSASLKLWTQIVSTHSLIDRICGKTILICFAISESRQLCSSV